MIRNLGNDGLDLALVGEVGFHRHGLDAAQAGLRRHRLGLGGGAVIVDRDVPAVLGQAQGDRLADTLGRPCDEGDFERVLIGWQAGHRPPNRRKERRRASWPPRQAESRRRRASTAAAGLWQDRCRFHSRGLRERWIVRSAGCAMNPRTSRACAVALRCRRSPPRRFRACRHAHGCGDARRAACSAIPGGWPDWTRWLLIGRCGAGRDPGAASEFAQYQLLTRMRDGGFALGRRDDERGRGQRHAP